MKKITKIFAAFAALTLVAGAFASCSSEDEWVQTKAPTPPAPETPPATKYKCAVCQNEYDTQAEASACDLTSACPGYVAPFQSVTWKFGDYITLLGATSSSSKISDLGKSGTACGIAVLGDNVKVRADGSGIAGTLSEGVNGYCQLSAGKAGSIKISVPAGASKITFCAKLNATIKLLESDGTTVITTKVGTASQYEDFELTFTKTTADKEMYLGDTSASVNFKAFKIE